MTVRRSSDGFTDHNEVVIQLASFVMCLLYASIAHPAPPKLPQVFNSTYFFTIASGRTHEELADLLVRSALRFGININVIRPTGASAMDLKYSKILGILGAPAWAERIVFMDADTVLVNPEGLQVQSGAVLQDYVHYAYTRKEPRRVRVLRKLDCLARKEGVAELHDGPLMHREWNSGVICGPRDMMLYLADRWQWWWQAIKAFWPTVPRDQISFRYAYLQAKKQFGFDDLSPAYNFCYFVEKMRRLSPPPQEAKILHWGGNMDYETLRRGRVQCLSELVLGGLYEHLLRHQVTYDAEHTCRCRKRNCGCSGGIHSYAHHYRAVLAKRRPRTVVEWGPGLNTQLALDAGAQQVVSVEHQQAYLYQGDCERVESRLCALNSKDYVSPPHLDSADLFFVDGRRRVECLMQICRHAKPSAVICLHDAQRRRYFEALQLFEHVRFPQFGFAVCQQRRH